MSILKDMQMESIRICVLESIGSATLDMLIAYDAAVHAVSAALRVDKKEADGIVREVEADIADAYERKKASEAALRR